MELTVLTEDQSTACTLSLTGEVDVYTSPQLKKQLLEIIENGCVNIIVDLNGLDFVDSSGLGVLVSCLRRVKEQDGTLRLVCSKESILKIFRITGLDKVFPVFATVEEAQAF